MKFFLKALLAYTVGALLGACAALLAVEYDWNVILALSVAMVITAGVDFVILGAEF